MRVVVSSQCSSVKRKTFAGVRRVRTKKITKFVIHHPRRRRRREPRTKASKSSGTGRLHNILPRRHLSYILLYVYNYFHAVSPLSLFYRILVDRAYTQMYILFWKALCFNIYWFDCIGLLFAKGKYISKSRKGTGGTLSLLLSHFSLDSGENLWKISRSSANESSG